VWGDLYNSPVFVLTADQDWAPEWAMAAFLEETRALGVPLHVFATNPSPTLATRVDAFSLGAHPNFLPGSTQGSSVEEVIAYCRRLVPEATTFRCHSFYEDTPTLRRLASHGFVADSNLGLFCQPGLCPLLHCSGLLRFPIYFEDDVFAAFAGPSLSLEPLKASLFSPGLKIFNFHPVWVARNVSSPSHYASLRTDLYGERRAERAEPSPGPGIRDVLRDLVSSVSSAGGHFLPFPAVVAAAFSHLAQTRPPYLYGWGSPT
jgi:hypothetical protein